MVVPLLTELPASIELSVIGFACHSRRPLSRLPNAAVGGDFLGPIRMRSG